MLYFALPGDRPAPVTYVPPAPPENEEEIFKSIQEGINFDKYDSIPVEVTGDNPVKPINTFDEANLYNTFLQNVKKAHYHKPTPVQKYAIPSILAGRDLMACAQTGSGKTVSSYLYLLTLKIFFILFFIFFLFTFIGIVMLYFAFQCKLKAL